MITHNSNAYSAAVSSIWRHYELGDAAHDHVNLVRYATLAASSHNTQPWKFKLQRGSVTIFPDFARRCTEVDPDDHHLYASLGCAIENLVLAAQAAGLDSCCSYDAAASNVQVDFTQGPIFRSTLFEAIPERQCSRAMYDGTPLTLEELRLLEESGRGNGVAVKLLTDSRQKEEIAEYVVAGNTAQFDDPRWAEELRKWIRFSGREAAYAGDGLFGPVMGMPDVPRWLGQLVMNMAVSVARQNRKDVAHIRSSGAIAVLVSEASDKRHWIEAGRCYERLALQAAALNLRSAFINQPVEVSSLRAQFAAYLGIGNQRPDLVVRLGHGPPMPRSLRRPVHAVLL